MGTKKSFKALGWLVKEAFWVECVAFWGSGLDDLPGFLLFPDVPWRSNRPPTTNGTPRVWGGPGLSQPCCRGSAQRWDPLLRPFFSLQVFLPSARMEELQPGSYACLAPSV